MAKLPKMHDKEPVELYTLDEIQAETTEMEGKWLFMKWAVGGDPLADRM